MKNFSLYLFAAMALFCGIAICFSGCKSRCDNKGQDEVIHGFAKVRLTADVSKYSKKDKELLSCLFDVAQIMDDIFWKEALGQDKDEFLSGIENDTVRKFAVINYGPWERLRNNMPFIDGYGEKPKGAQFYPEDMTREEFDALEDENKTSLYTVIRRDNAGKLNVVWYHEAFKEQIEKAAELLEKAASLSEDKGFANYLQLRAKALRTDDYLESDLAWMDMRTNKFDFIVGPIENYEDQLYGYKAAHESFILLKDEEWSKKLEKFTALLPDLQKELPIDEKYKKDPVGSESQLNVYNAVFYRGDCNAGSKTIAINLPNDERVHAEKGTRKLQLKNAMQAKFEKITLPISKLLLNEEQQKEVTFTSFFENVTFHEVSHGLGVKNTIDGKATVRHALKEVSGTLEEAKADVMGLYMVDELNRKGLLSEHAVEQNYITFFCGIFRSVRFGTASAHGKANMIEFDHFAKNGVFTRSEDGVYTVDVKKMREATRSLMVKLLTCQGNGDYKGAKKWVAEANDMSSDLVNDLIRIEENNIPRDIFFEQGKDVVGIK
ncbi:MAG: Zn-dependent hydrolase [Bacteroidales bacterium]|nr:Zn-dependent hydrolase [Bacteroidales bacterium]